MIRIFKRRWWKNNSSWPNGLEPDMGRKTYLETVETEAEARVFCEQWNKDHEPGRYSVKAEYEFE